MPRTILPESQIHPAVREKIADRKSTRLNSSHGYISYAVFCLKKKKKRYRVRILRSLFRKSFKRNTQTSTRNSKWIRPQRVTGMYTQEKTTNTLGIHHQQCTKC